MFRRSLFLIIFVLAACQVSENETLPTVQVLPSPTATVTPAPRLNPTLPPTFTATPEPVAELTNTPVPESAAPSSERFFFVRSGDTLLSMALDGTDQQELLSFGPGQPLTDLTLSPDGTLLALVAPGAGSARELYVLNLDGTYRQQVSCLGLADVRDPAWTPDGSGLAFYAAPQIGATGAIYRVNLAGSNNCPVGNNQGMLVPLSAPVFTGLAWNRDGDILFYGDNGPIVAYSLSDGQTQEVTLPTGFGPDFAPYQDPNADRLFYFITLRDMVTGQQGGGLSIVPDTRSLPEEPIGERGPGLLALSTSWSPEGKQALIRSELGLLRYEAGTQSVQTILDAGVDVSLAVFAPDSRRFAVVSPGPETSSTLTVWDNQNDPSPEIFIVSGTLTELVWIETSS